MAAVTSPVRLPGGNAAAPWCGGGYGVLRARLAKVVTPHSLRQAFSVPLLEASTEL